MQNVFITGAAGFIGGYAAREFVEQGWHVFALIRSKSSTFLEESEVSGSVTIIRGDLNDFAEVEQRLRDQLEKKSGKLDAIVHCAGRASDVGRWNEFRKANFESVQNLCELSNNLNINRFVFISTTDVYGMHDFNGESESELPLQNNTNNPYPKFKIAAEEWIRKTMPKERFSIIRPAAVWGVGDPTLTPRMVSFLKSSPWIIHFGKWHGKNRWPLAHVRNVSAAIFLATIISEAAGNEINVLDNEITSIDEFYRIIASIYLPGKKLRSITLPMCIGKAIGYVVSSISNLLNLDHPFTDPSIYALYSISSNLDFSNKKLLSMLKLAGRNIVTKYESMDELQKSMF